VTDEGGTGYQVGRSLVGLPQHRGPRPRVPPCPGGLHGRRGPTDFRKGHRLRRPRRPL